MKRTETYLKIKEKAAELMSFYGIYKPYVNAFKSNQQRITMYEGIGIGYYVDGLSNGEDKLLLDRIAKIEEQDNVVVFAVTHNVFEFGECYEFLYLTEDCLNEDEDADKGYFYDDGMLWVPCCVYNKSYDEIEYGDCGFIVSFAGGFVRKG